jgi:hypothetical protein
MRKIGWSRQRSCLLALSLAVGTLLSNSAIAWATEDEPEHGLINIPLPQVVIQPPTIDLSQFRRGLCADGLVGSSDRQINPEGTTIPSLWWTRDIVMSKPQFNTKLIEGWLVCGAGTQNADARVCSIAPKRPGRVEMLVNTGLWQQLDYLNRYEFLARFGDTTSECGYNIYIFNTEATLIADFTCDFQAKQSRKSCVLRSDLSGKGGLRRQATDEFFATDYRIDVF